MSIHYLSSRAQIKPQPPLRKGKKNPSKPEVENTEQVSHQEQSSPRSLHHWLITTSAASSQPYFSLLSWRARWKRQACPATSVIIHNRTPKSWSAASKNKKQPSKIKQKNPKQNKQHPGTFELIPVLYFAARFLGNVVNNPTNSVECWWGFLFCFYRTQEHVEFQFCSRTLRNQGCSCSFYYFITGLLIISEIKTCRRPVNHPFMLSHR